MSRHDLASLHCSVPWNDRDIWHIRLHHSLFRHFRLSTCTDWLAKYKVVRNHVVSKLCSAKSIFQEFIQEQLIPRNFLHSLKPKSSDCPTALSYGSTTAITKQFKADHLNQFFTSSFNPSVVQHSYRPSMQAVHAM